MTKTAEIVKPAADFEQSGAPIQPGGFDSDHPAIDNDPRAGTSVEQNQIDLNDPVLTGAQAVERAMGDSKKG